MNTILKEKDFDYQVESIDEDKELTIADDFLEKEEEESSIQKFCEMKSKKRIRKFKKILHRNVSQRVHQRIEVKSSHISNELLFLLENKKITKKGPL